MQSQIRLRLTGDESGSGVCALMEDINRVRYRISLEGPAGQDLEVVLQGRSPYMDVFQTVTALERFSGSWQQEGDIPTMPCQFGWLWVLKGGRPWLHTAFPGVGTPLEAAHSQLMKRNLPDEPPRPMGQAAPEQTDTPALIQGNPEFQDLLIRPAKLRFTTRDQSGYIASEQTGEAAYRWLARPGTGEDIPFDPEALFCGAAHGGYWILREKVTRL